MLFKWQLNGKAPSVFWRCHFNASLGQVSLLSLRSYDTITDEAGTAASVLKAKFWKRRRAFQKHALHFKGQGHGFEKPNNFSEAWFCLCCRGICCSKISWHLGGVGRTDLHKKGGKNQTFKGALKGQYPNPLPVWGILFGQSCCWAFCDQTFVCVLLHVWTAACRR